MRDEPNVGLRCRNVRSSDTKGMTCGVSPGGSPPGSSLFKARSLIWRGRRLLRRRSTLCCSLSGSSQIKQRPAAMRRWRYDRPREVHSREQVQKVLIHLDSRTVAMEVGIR